MELEPERNFFVFLTFFYSKMLGEYVCSVISFGCEIDMLATVGSLLWNVGIEQFRSLSRSL